MSNIYVENLAMIITEQCNLECEHCLRGQCSNRVMSDDVIEATLDQIVSIVNLKQQIFTVSFEGKNWIMWKNSTKTA